MKFVHGLRNDGDGARAEFPPHLRGSWKYGWVLWFGARYFIGVLRKQHPLAR